jgi:hypothetical protein
MTNKYPDILPTPTVPVASLPVITATDLESDVVVQFPLAGLVYHRDSYQLLLNDQPVGTPVEIPDPAPELGTVLSLRIPVATELKEDGVYTMGYRMTNWPGNTPADSPRLMIRVDRSTLPS